MDATSYALWEVSMAAVLKFYNLAEFMTVGVSHSDPEEESLTLLQKRAVEPFVGQM